MPAKCQHPPCHCEIEQGQWCGEHCEETDQRAEYCACEHESCADKGGACHIDESDEQQPHVRP